MVAAARTADRAAQVLGKAGPATGTVALRAGSTPAGGILFVEQVSRVPFKLLLGLLVVGCATAALVARALLCPSYRVPRLPFTIHAPHSPAQGVDITNPETLTPELFRGVTQVVTAVGAVFGRTAEGAMG